MLDRYTTGPDFKANGVYQHAAERVKQAGT